MEIKKNILELTGFEYSLNCIKWKPIIRGRYFGNDKQTIYIRPRQADKCIVEIEEKQYEFSLMELKQDKDTGETIMILKK